MTTEESPSPCKIADAFSLLEKNDERVIRIVLSEEVRGELHESHTDGTTLWGAEMNIRPVGREITLFGARGTIITVAV